MVITYLFILSPKMPLRCHQDDPKVHPQDTTDVCAKMLPRYAPKMSPRYAPKMPLRYAPQDAPKVHPQDGVKGRLQDARLKFEPPKYVFLINIS